MQIESISNKKSEETPKSIENLNVIEIDINDKKYKLEISKYDFEYPERIQKETGIIGYERTKISANSLFEVIKNKAGTILHILGVETYEDFLKIYEYYLSIRRNKSFNDYRKIEKMEEVFISINEKIINLLSNEEYPNLCYTHRMGAYTYNSDTFNQQFKEDHFFLQKIYDQKRIKKNDTNYGYGNHGSSCSFYKDNGDILEKHCDMREVNNKSEIKENTAFAAMPNGGLNFWMGDFWRNDVVDEVRSVSFGIPFHSDTFQEEYIKKSLKIFCKIEKNEIENLSKKEGEDPESNSKIFSYFRSFRGINGAIIMYAFNEYLKNHPEYVTQNKENNPKFNFKEIILEESFEKEFSTIVNNFLIDQKVTLEDNSYNIEDLLDTVDQREINLPIFMNHKELPQVSWGYAKYAHYMNKQGLNFIKFKHADHLPSKNIEI